jgi:hypothetical protein
MVSLALQFIGDISLTSDGDVERSAALAEAETLAANGTEDVGENTNVVLGDTLALVDLVAARHVGTVATLVDCVAELILRLESRVGARQGHGGSNEKEGSGEELHLDGGIEKRGRRLKVSRLRVVGSLWR